MIFKIELSSSPGHSLYKTTKSKSYLTNLLDSIAVSVDKGEATAIYVDFRKVFDMVPPKYPPLPIGKLWIWKRTVQCTRNWLWDFTLRVVLNGSMSGWRLVATHRGQYWNWCSLISSSVTLTVTLNAPSTSLQMTLSYVVRSTSDLAVNVPVHCKKFGPDDL